MSALQYLTLLASIFGVAGCRLIFCGAFATEPSSPAAWGSDDTVAEDK